MQVLSLIASFTALRQAILGKESEKILPSILRYFWRVWSKRILLRDGSGQPSRVSGRDLSCAAT